MSRHSQIIAEFDRQYTFISDAVLISPSALAYGAYQEFCDGEEDEHIQYTSLEHMKHMARRYLADRNDADSDGNPAHGEQTSFEFLGKLQDRYPLPRKNNDGERVYKLRMHLTDEERQWNADQLRKAARSRLKHADALEAEGLAIQSRGANMAAMGGAAQ